MAIDPLDGAVWVGAGKTLYRFDSQGGVELSLPLFRKIDALALDTAESRLWLAAGDTLTAYGRTGSVVGVIGMGRYERVQALAFDVVSNQLCVALHDTLRRYDAAGTLVSECRFRKIEQIAADTRGCLWVASERSLARMSSSGEVLLEIDPPRWRGHGRIMDLAADLADCSVWVLGNTLLAHVDVDGTLLSLADPDPVTRGRARALALYRDLTAPTLQITAPAH